MKHLLRFNLPVLAVVAVGVLGVSTARADVITGPVLDSADSDYAVSGIGFTANVNATLTSFTFQNQGQADTVDLVDPLGNILDSVTTPGSTPSYTASVNWSLTSGDQYYLLQTTENNALFTGWELAAPSDTEITLVDTGDFSFSSIASADFALGGAAGSETEEWADFNYITTSSGSSAPEPASFLLVVPFAAAMYLKCRKQAIGPVSR
jgi:hypothetical protein